MLTLGIDLAASTPATAAATIVWTSGSARVDGLVERADDATLTALALDADATGIDCALGWPVPFVDFIARHNDGLPPTLDTGIEGWRRALTMRSTDRACAAFTLERLGKAVRPLSVSADLLGHVAMRCAALLGELGAAGVEVDRSGSSGRVTEVYPAAGLALWGLADRSYKGAPRRGALVDVVAALAGAAPWLRWAPGVRERCSASDHAFDAVLAALATRAWALGRCTRPATENELRLARIEGWISLPTGPLSDLAPAD